MPKPLELDLLAAIHADQEKQEERLDRLFRFGRVPLRARYRKGKKPKFRALSRLERVHREGR